MDRLLLFIFALVGLVILIKWRLRISQKKLEGTPVPEAAGPQHPDGMLYYFYHPGCGPCRSMLPVIDELREKYPDRIEKLNVADCRDMALAMGIRATPTTLLVKNNKVSRAFIGAKSYKALEAMLILQVDHDAARQEEIKSKGN